MESCPTQAALPWVGLAAEKVIRDRYISARVNHGCRQPTCFQPPRIRKMAR
ncbi:MAG: hypothetical protein R6U98_13855 [Pirellulaceae bacterium]